MPPLRGSIVHQATTQVSSLWAFSRVRERHRRTLCRASKFPGRRESLKISAALIGEETLSHCVGHGALREPEPSRRGARAGLARFHLYRSSALNDTSLQSNRKCDVDIRKELCAMRDFLSTHRHCQYWCLPMFLFGWLPPSEEYKKSVSSQALSSHTGVCRCELVNCRYVDVRPLARQQRREVRIHFHGWWQSLKPWSSSWVLKVKAHRCTEYSVTAALGGGHRGIGSTGAGMFLIRVPICVSPFLHDPAAGISFFVLVLEGKRVL